MDLDGIKLNNKTDKASGNDVSGEIKKDYISKSNKTNSLKPEKTPKTSGGKWFLMMILILIAYQWGLYRGKNIKPENNNPVPLKEAKLEHKDSTSNQVDFSLFWDAWELLKEKYVDAKSLDANQMVYDSIKGMVASTHDPYTVFLDPEENKEFNQEMEGSFEGIGAEVGIKNGILTIIAPLQGSPAEKAGLRAGDKVIKINGENAADISIDEAVKKMRGPKGTELKLTIFRNNGDEETKEITVIRGLINIASVKKEIKKVENKKIVHFTISRFGENTAQEFMNLAQGISKEGISGIIIDLRNDPGGYLDQAVKLASQMLEKGKVVVIEEDGDGKQEKLLAQGGDYLSQYKTVVLINKGSASASEILSGALRDNRNNVTIVGETSYGKGSVQQLIPMARHTALKVTVAKWLTPSGQQINKKGIKPDVEVKLTKEDFDKDRDPQLDKALEILTQ